MVVALVGALALVAPLLLLEIAVRGGLLAAGVAIAIALHPASPSA